MFNAVVGGESDTIAHSAVEMVKVNRLKPYGLAVLPLKQSAWMILINIFGQPISMNIKIYCTWTKSKLY